ncbi:TRI59 protein, partial [Galbula dea]|nr:TRI59 protein [Galbula dea]
MHPFEEELTCSICYNLFEDPRILPCSHTFCKRCLESLVLSTSSCSLWIHLRLPLKCPNCRFSVEIPATGLESLPINFAVKAIVEKYQQGDQAEVTCSEHHRQPLNIYCLLDRKLICGHCVTVGEHYGHPIADLQSAHMKERNTAGKLLEQLTDKHWSDVCLLLERLREQKSECEGAVRCDRKVVVQYFKKFSETLEQTKQALLSALDEVNTHISTKYDPLIESLKQMRQEQLDLIQLSTSIQREESPLVFLEKVSDMQRRVKALKEKQLPDVTPVEVYPRVALLLSDTWFKSDLRKISKIVPPKIEVIRRRKSLIKGSGWQGRKVKALLQAVNPSMVVLIFITLMVTVVSFHQPLSSVVFEAAPAWISQLLLPVYQHFHTPLQNVVDMLCCAISSV